MHYPSCKTSEIPSRPRQKTLRVWKQQKEKSINKLRCQTKADLFHVREKKKERNIVTLSAGEQIPSKTPLSIAINTTPFSIPKKKTRSRHQ
jgi:hypothetical protein